LAEDAMAAAYGVFDHDLRYFDNDGPDGIPGSGDDDGYVDAVCVLHPGIGAETVAGPGANALLWSHEAGVATYTSCPPTASQADCLPGIVLGGVRGFLYFLVAEFNEFPGDRANGTYMHEFGHTLGLPDLYDPAAAGLGVFSLMALGNYLPLGTTEPIGSMPSPLDPWCRQFLGFEDPVVPGTPIPPLPAGHLAPAAGALLGPLSRGGSAIKLWTDGRPGTEYFLLENRVKESIDSGLPGS